ncbi:MAG: SDR family oxidoreductase [Chitinophagaceae bacterium]|nr:MAG: SDR family oxidoreductase [Chitinophagaceae bacterium]
MNALEQFSLKGKVIVVTGGTGVLGGAFTESLASAGAKVAIIGRNKDRANERARSVREAGGEALPVIADVLDEEQVHRAKTEILQRWEKIDGLINAAGGNVPGAVISPDQDLFSVKTEDIKKAVDLNLYGTVIPTQIFAEEMSRYKKGVILNISSLAAQRPLTRVLGYSVAKAAIESYTRWMAVELAQRYGDGMRINALAPGVFLTVQNKDLLLNKDGSYAERTQKFITHTPFGRLGLPEELTGTVIWLMSDASKFVNGETVLVDGGFNAYSGV